MNLFELNDGTMINLECIQTISPVDNNGFNLYVFRINFNNHWVEVVGKTREEAERFRGAIISMRATYNRVEG